MPTHRYHPDKTRLETEAPLYDDCERCEEHAEDPIRSLDGSKSAQVWDIMINIERRPGAAAYPNATTGKAAKHFYRVAIFLERIGVYPWLPYDELTRRYGVQA